ncbi:MAG: hypothetical protein ACJ76D_01215 [Solirubrobacterales bacterium]
MKRISALGVALCAVIALTGAFAPASASATVLCSKQVTPCGANVYAAETQVKAALPAMTTTVIETELVTVTCLTSRIGIKTSAVGGKGLSVPGRVNEFALEQCTVPDGLGGTESCAVKPVNYGAAELEQWTAFFEQGNNGNGKFGISTSNLGNFGFSVLCNQKVEKINCTFLNGTSSTVTGGPGTPAATITGPQKMKPVAGGKKCPAAEATWKFTWAVSVPAAFYLEAE